MKKVLLVALCLALAAPALAADLKSICDVQKYNGIAEGDLVRISGVAVADSGRYGGGITVLAQQGGGPWCFVAVYDAGVSWTGEGGEAPCTTGAPRQNRFEAVAGDCYTVEGAVTEYYELTEVKMFCEEQGVETLFYQKEASCFAIPDPMIVPTGEVMDEQYEWCLVEVQSSNVTRAPDDFGVFQLDDGSGVCNGLGSKNWPDFNPQVGDFFCAFAGVQDYSWSQFRIRPRTLEDDVDLTPEEDCSGGSTPTPTPSPTPTSGGDFTVTVKLNQTGCYSGGDQFVLTCEGANTGAAKEVDLGIVLDINGSAFYFWDGWTTDFMVKRTTFAPGTTTLNILNFSWPQGAGSSTGLNLGFWGAAFEPGDWTVTGLAAPVTHATFCFE